VKGNVDPASIASFVACSTRAGLLLFPADGITPSAAWIMPQMETYMTDRIKIAAAQLNATVGDVAGNAGLARDAHAQAREDGADLLVLPEMFIGGYQLQDLVRKPAFIETCRREVAALALATTDGPPILIGCPLYEEGLVFNAVYLLRDGVIDTVFRKHELPNYGVFDEKRFFVPGPAPARCPSPVSASASPFARMRGSPMSAKPWWRRGPRSSSCPMGRPMRVTSTTCA
jgi:hypothetical protein